MIPTKSQAAFEFTAQRLFDESKELYFWTFTFIKVPIDDSHAMHDFKTLMARLAWHFPMLRGIRVCELHRSHGIHFHLIFNQRIPIRRLKEIAYGTGKLLGSNRYLDFGRMSVSPCEADTIGYLVKYMSKDYRQRFNFGQRRRWGTVGGQKAVRVRDIEYSSETTRNRKRLFNSAKVPFLTYTMIHHYTQLWGHLSKWPEEHKANVLKQCPVNWMKQRYQNQPF